MYYVYILKSIKLNKIYKGLSGNIDRRLNEHFSAKVPATRHMLPLKLVHVEICKTRIEARKLEKYFKNGYGREILAEVLKLVDKHA